MNSLTSQNSVLNSILTWEQNIYYDFISFKNNTVSQLNSIDSRLVTINNSLSYLARIPTIETLVSNIYNQLCEATINNYYPEGEIDGMDIGELTDLQLDSIKGHFSFVSDFSASGKNTLISLLQGEPTTINFTVSNTPERYHLNGKVISISNSWFTQYKTYVDTISSVFFVVGYLIWLWGQLPNILNGYISLTSVRNGILDHNNSLEVAEAEERNIDFLVNRAVDRYNSYGENVSLFNEW